VSEAAIRFRYKELAVATENFSNELGKGGFGSVYKGVLANGQAVGMKKLDDSVEGEKQIRVERALQIQHRKEPTFDIAIWALSSTLTT
jgi:predicted Ser/Thr protein kinase